MKKITLLFLMLLGAFAVSAQCINTSSYLNPTAANDGSVEQIATCTYSTEYNTISGLIVGADYQFVATASGVDAYVTITDLTDTVIAFGPSPLVVSAITSTEVRLHVTADAACTGGSVCHVTSFQNTSVTCIQPSALTATNITTSGADLGWTENNAATTWNVEIVDVTAGGTQTMTATATGVANPYTVAGLVDGNDYEYYVQADCGGTDGVSAWSGPFSFTTVANCIAPTILTATNVTASGAELGWTENGTATLWNVEIVDITAGGTQTMTATTTGVTNPYTVMGLSDANDYEYYVQADCGTGSLSSWSGPFAFTTACIAFTAPYTEDFENGGDIPNCWANNGAENWLFNLSGPNYVGTGGTLSGTTVSGGYYAAVDASGTQANAILLSPLVDVSGLTTPALSFYEISDNEGDANSQLDVEVWDGAAWNTVGTYNTNTVGWELKVINLSSLTITGDIQARFTFTEPTPTDFYDDIAIDDITFDEAPSCFDPSMLTATSITDSSADLGWTENGSATSWNIEIVDVTAGGVVTGTATATGVSNPYAATGLNESNDYEFYVQADCGTEGLSNWSGPFAFTTACIAFTAPYSEDFETTAIGSSSNETTPNCWSFIDGGNGYGYVTTNNGSNAFRLYNGLDSSGDYILVSPETTNISDGTFRVKYDVDGANNQEFIVGTMSDPLDGATFTAIETVTLTSSNAEDYVTNIPAGTDSYLAFKHGLTDNFDSYYIDNIVIEAQPSCLEPSDLSVSNILPNQADLAWIAQGSETLWNIEIVDITAGGTQTMTATTTGVTNPYTVMGLNDANDYEYYVQADCTGGDLSTWVGPFAFTTACEVFMAPYSEDFESFTVATSAFTLENCWSGTVSSSNYLWEVAATTDTSSSGTGPGANVSAGNYLFTEATSGSTGDIIDVISPLIDLSTLTSPSLTFDYHMFGGNMGTLEVLVNGSDSVFTVSGQQQLEDEAFITQTIDLATYSGQTISVTFRATRGDGFESDMAIDTVVFDEAPSCFMPSNLLVDSITTDSANLSWVANSSESLWNIEIVDITAGETFAGVATISGVTSNPYSLTGLTDLNTYEFYIQADCTGGDVSNWAGPFSFTTLCNAFAMPFSEGFNSDSMTQSCWTVLDENSDGDLWNLDYSSNPFEGDESAMMYTDFNGGNNDDWLISPGLMLTGSEALTFQQRVQSSGEPNDFELLLSTTGTATADFTETLIANTSYSNTEYQEFSVDLSAYTGTVYIAWHIPNGGLDGWRLYIDDVLVETVSLSVDEFANQSLFSYYPNPVNNTLTLNAQQAINNVSVFNMLGQEVIKSAPNAVSKAIDMSNLQSGAYFVQVTVGNAVETVRIIKN